MVAPVTWLLWLAACAGCLAIGHILGAGWPDLQVRHILALEEIERLRAQLECHGFDDMPDYELGDTS